MKKKVRISVLVSGGGSNLQSLIDTYKDSETCEIVQVISSKPEFTPWKEERLTEFRDL